MMKTYFLLFFFITGCLHAQGIPKTTYTGTFSGKGLSFVVGKITVNSHTDLDSKKKDETPTEVLQIYPNPVETTLNIEHAKEIIITKVSILALDGKLLYTAQSPEAAIDISFLNKGIYIFRVEYNGTVKSYKISKN
ncbi:MAG: T9SS type A sorting domain-containing protein [Flavobacterium sp.]|nr:T9SS type A sorting domain-containing protein [Flavobacterium sp.]